MSIATRPCAPTVLPRWRASIHLPRYAGEERNRASLLLHREAGEVALGAKRRVTEGAQGRLTIP